MPDLDRFPTYDYAIRVNCRGDATFGKRHTLTPPADELVQHLARFREEHALLFVKRKDPWLKAPQARHYVDDFVLKLFQSLFIQLHIKSF